MNRRARLTYQPLTEWPYPPVKRADTPFSAPWATTTDLLQREADFLGARLVVIELDVEAPALRLDRQLRADARAMSERVRVSMTTRHGPLAWHCDRYRLVRGGHLGWRENVRAIALTLEALRAVDRYGAVSGAEQYQGFAAIEAPAAEFASADEAVRWLCQQGGVGKGVGTPKAAYRAAARRLHPDAGGDPADWARLDQARQLLEKAGLL